MKFEPGMVCKTRDGREVEILKTDAPGPRPIVGLVLSGFNKGEAQSWYADGLYGTGAEFYFGLIPPKRTREVTVYVNVLKHEGIEWNTTHDSYTVAKYSTTILDPRIEVLAVAVPATFTVEW